VSIDHPTEIEDLAAEHVGPRKASLLVCVKCKQELDWSFRRVKPEYQGDHGNFKGLAMRDHVWIYIPCDNVIRCPDPDCREAPAPLPDCKRCKGTGKKICGWKNARTTDTLQKFARGVARAAAPSMLTSLVGLYHHTSQRAEAAGSDRDAGNLTQASARLAKVILSITGLERRSVDLTVTDEREVQDVDAAKEELIRQLRESEKMVVSHEATMAAHGLDPYAVAPEPKTEAPQPERG